MHGEAVSRTRESLHYLDVSIFTHILSGRINMGSIKKKLGIAVLVAGLVAVAITFVSVVSSNASEKVEIRLAHNQTAGSEIADSIAKFADFVAEDPSQNLDVKIYASGVLGSEQEAVEMVKAGILDMAKINANTLSQFDDRYAIFATPYLFVSQEHYYKAMEESKLIQDLFMATEDQGFIAMATMPPVQEIFT